MTRGVGGLGLRGTDDCCSAFPIVDRYYVNTKDANPQAIWTHPAESNAAPATASPAPATGQTTEPVGGGDPPNPDTRPLPEGWIGQYDANHKTFFYVNTKHADPGSTVTWTHPAENNYPPAADSYGTAPAATPAAAGAAAIPAAATPSVGGADTAGAAGAGVAPAGVSPTPPAVSQSPVPAAPGTPVGGGPQNPDARSLPTGWITKYDENYKAWYYVDTTKPDGPSSWQHPVDIPGASYPSSQSPAPSTGGPENPDKRPLPPGWITQFDKNYNAWYYVKTDENPPVTIWEHPVGKADSHNIASQPSAATPDPAAGGLTSPVGGAATATGAPEAAHSAAQ
ncbi:hypothetical protein FRC20_007518, partial [Serendipita sp. 405]